MKKIGKLSINPEKVIKNEELVNLKGGYGGVECSSPEARYMCQCTYIPGLWTDCYDPDDSSERLQDLVNYCGGGTMGTCWII